jgi:1-deoxy-D-xylulose-5-phosphate synthase
MSGPRVIHVMTQKGKGFSFAESNQEKWHGLAAYDPVTGEARKKASGPPTWTQVFGDGLTALAGEHPELVAITAAMPSGTGTNIFQKKYPSRFFDVGIAEGHAVTFAGGLATQGIRPVVAIYSTFPPAGLRQRHPRYRRAAPAGDVLHGPRGTGRRGRADPHGSL